MTTMAICPNKGAGKLGRRVRIEANYLALRIAQMIENAYHYDVTIEPNIPKRLLQRVFGNFRETNFPKIFMAFDGQKNAYSPCKLDLSKPLKREIDVPDDETGKPRKFTVMIKETRDSVVHLGSLKK